MGILNKMLSLVVLMVAISPAICPAEAGGAWPTRTVRVIVPFPAGGGPDPAARLLADGLQKRWGRPVVIENRPGVDASLVRERQ
jgi:tripartite-type tricarboxylate transporter receptor subunit TctC